MRRRYNASKGGHAPGHLRECFEEWVIGSQRRGLPCIGEKSIRASWLFGQLWNCTDLMPGQLCFELDLPAGSTYAQGIRSEKRRQIEKTDLSRGMMTEKYYSPAEIYYVDGGLGSLDYEKLSMLLARTLVWVPADTIHYVFNRCRFLMPEPEEKGCFIPKSLFKGMDIIAFPFSILDEPEEQQTRTVLHEVAHLVLGHKSPIMEDGIDQDAQEEEAERQVDEWLRNKETQQAFHLRSDVQGGDLRLE